jgi:DNA-binding transcriptional regulator YiaG
MTAATFRATLKKLGLTQAEFARRLRVSTTAVQYWANGQRPVPGYAEAYLELLAEKRS